MKVARKQFLTWLGAPVAAGEPAAEKNRPEVLLVVAHPDDEYAFAGAVYRIAKELGGTVDQAAITNGEAGYRYSQLAERFYRARLTDEAVGRGLLPRIRRNEKLAAGRVLGIRRHYFLEQKDSRFTLDVSEALRVWNTERLVRWLATLMERERYDFVFTLLPPADTHGHHKAATLLTLRAVASLAAPVRPAVLGGDPAAATDPVRRYDGLNGHAETAPWAGAPVFRFDRTARFGFRNSLSYQIVVNSRDRGAQEPGAVPIGMQPP